MPLTAAVAFIASALSAQPAWAIAVDVQRRVVAKANRPIDHASAMRTLAANARQGNTRTQAPRSRLVAREVLGARVLDPEGKPLAGVVVEAWRAEGQGTGMLDLPLKRNFHRVASARSDEQGRVRLRVPRALPVQIRVDRAPFARFRRNLVVGGSGLEIRLQQAATFAGQILRKGDSMPMQSNIRVWLRHSDSTEIVNAPTDKKGRFRFERLMPGLIRVDVDPVSATGIWRDFELQAGKELEERIEVTPGILLRGRVLDAATGKPIKGAEVGEGWTFSKAVHSNAQGKYEMRGFASSGSSATCCRAPGYVKQMRWHGGEKRASPYTLDWRLERGDSVTGQVLDPRGKPLGGAYVAVIGMTHGGGVKHYHDWVSTRSDADGRFRLSGLEPKLEHVVMLRCDGLAALVYHLPRPNKEGVRRAGKLRMQRARVLRGRIVDADGKPIPRAKIGLWGCNADRELLAKGAAMEQRNQGGGWSLLRRYVAQRPGRSDDQGRFAFGDLAAGSYGLVVYSERNQKLASKKGIIVEREGDPNEVVLKVER